MNQRRALPAARLGACAAVRVGGGRPLSRGPDRRHPGRRVGMARAASARVVRPADDHARLHRAGPGAGRAPDCRDRHRVRPGARTAVRDGGLPGQRVGRIRDRPLARARADRTLGRSAASAGSRRVLARNGTLAVFLVRKVPAPFALVNVVIGASAIRYREFVIGTTLGMGAFVIALAGFGYQLTEIWRHPSPPGVLRASLFLAIPLTAAWLINRRLRAEATMSAGAQQPGAASSRGRDVRAGDRASRPQLLVRGARRSVPLRAGRGRLLPLGRATPCCRRATRSSSSVGTSRPTSISCRARIRR